MKVLLRSNNKNQLLEWVNVYIQKHPIAQYVGKGRTDIYFADKKSRYYIQEENKEFILIKE